MISVAHSYQKLTASPARGQAGKREINLSIGMGGVNLVDSVQGRHAGHI
jgi:hypothetical protein